MTNFFKISFLVFVFLLAFGCKQGGGDDVGKTDGKDSTKTETQERVDPLTEIVKVQSARVNKIDFDPLICGEDGSTCVSIGASGESEYTICLMINNVSSNDIRVDSVILALVISDEEDELNTCQNTAFLNQPIRSGGMSGEINLRYCMAANYTFTSTDQFAFQIYLASGDGTAVTDTVSVCP